MWFRDFSIRKKLMFLVIIAGLPIAALTAIFAYRYVYSQVFSREKQKVKLELNHSLNALNRFLETACKDALFLARTSTVQELVNNTGKGIDNRDMRKRLGDLFQSLANSKGIYDQIRFIDNKGMEVVRVNWCENHVEVVPPSQLQNKKDRYYFSETAKLSPGSCYFSPIDLNREKGKIERPLKPVVRIGTPIWDSHGTFRGIIILNVLVQKALHIDCQEYSKSKDREIWFWANQDGFYLYHSTMPEKEWGGPNNLNSGEGLKKDFPNSFEAITKGEDIPVVWQGKNWYVFSLVAESGPIKPKFLIIGQIVPRKIVLTQVYRIVGILAGELALVVFLAGIVTVIGGKMISAPIEDLISNVTRLEKGDMTARVIGIKGKGEIARLTVGFNKMAKKIAKQHENLELQVAERTKELEKAKRAALNLMQDANIDRQRAEATATSFQKLSTAIEQSPVSVVITDLEGTIEYVNPKFCDLTGYTQEEAIGQNPRILKSDGHSQEFYREMWEDITSGKEWHGEFCNKKKTGETYWEHASVSPIFNSKGKITHFVAVKEDITKLKQVAEELRKAKDNAEKANRAKSDFLANMSHELRTPLNAIIGFSEVLENRTFGDLNEKQAQYVNHVLTSGKHLLDLINDILDLSKVEAGKMELDVSKFDITQLLENSLSLIREKTLKHNIDLELKLDDKLKELEIEADERKLKQIMLNLLSNAGKFTPDGGRITVTAKLERKNLTVLVTDTGIGISPEDQDRVFGEFEQVDSSFAKQQQGTGLGLALTKQLVELHEGKIWLESEGANKGCTFSFKIPTKQKKNAKKGKSGEKQNSDR